VLVNATCLCKSFFVVDSATMSLVMSIAVNTDDFKMTNSMMESLKYLLPQIKELFINNIDFGSFLGHLISEADKDNGELSV
jgi:hypothetical protein